MKKILIGVEGISYSGKTTFCNKVNEENPQKFLVVSESPKFANIDMKYTNDDNDIIANAKVTLEIEKKRTDFVNNNDNELFLYDRTIFSFLGISYAYKTSQKIDYFDDYFQKIINGIRNNSFYVPDYLIYLDLSDEELTNRIKIRKKHIPDYWVNEDFINALKKIYEPIISYYNASGRLIKSDVAKIKENDLTKIDKDEVISILGDIKDGYK